MLAGEAVELAGTIVSNIGGYNARSGYEALNETAPQFRGWIYFAAGLVCSVGGSLLSQTDFPLFPTIISISGFGFTLSSIIHSTNYASKAYMKSIVLQDVKIAPLVDRKLHVNGIRIAADF